MNKPVQLRKNRKKQTRAVLTGLAYLSPNIIGFLGFTLLPLIVSFVMAFTNWDLRFHNSFSGQSPHFVGFDNYIRLFSEPAFWQSFGNTLFMLMGLPIAIAGSLCAAILLSQESCSWRYSGYSLVRLVSIVVFISALVMLLLLGMGTTALTLLLGGIFSLILVGGTFGGNTVYRTLFYVPHLIAGVPVFILWKKLYSPETGPVNNGLRPVLGSLSDWISTTSPVLWQGVAYVLLGLSLFASFFIARTLSRACRNGDAGLVTGLVAAVLAMLPALGAWRWLPETSALTWLFPIVAIMIVGYSILPLKRVCREMNTEKFEGFGSFVLMAVAVMALAFVFLGLSMAVARLPMLAATPAGIEPPEWLGDYYWAKPSLMIMGIWAAIGSNQMILFIAGLLNVPTELYEAAEIDGANRFQKFWYVTWPQLAPITFFVVVMGVIGGLQGGFEMARTMTGGGPAGATTTLSYYIYNEGFETGRIAYASALSWILFLFVLSVTLLNVRFGSRYTSD